MRLRHPKNHANATLGDKKITLQSGQLTYAERHGEQRINRLKAIGESSRCYFLFKDDIAAFIIPKRAFTTEDQAKSFLMDLQSSLLGTQPECAAMG